MKAKKKPHGIKQKIREEKEREKCILVRVFTAAILITIISISGFIANSMLNNSATSISKLKAAIVDHLSLTMSNQTFIQTATNTLKQVVYTVDYYPSEKVNVEFYRDLPTHDYNLIIFRVHSTGGGVLFTSERYSTSEYIYEQLTDKLLWVAYSPEDAKKYFGIPPSFVESSMNGRFTNTIVIMMGCNGLTYIDMAKAFISRGAKVYISWSDSVSASHTDTATACLLQHFLIENLTLTKSLQETFKEVGYDPVYKSSLLIYYPFDAGEQTILNITRNKE